MKTRIIYVYMLTLFLLASCGFIRMKKFARTLENRSIVSKDFVEKIKFRQDDMYIYINAKVNRDTIEREFILDTGSPTFFFTKAEDVLDLDLKRLYNFGKNNRAKQGVTNVKIGSIEYENLGYIFQETKGNHLGMIGCNTMQNTIWSFNFKDSVITISDNIENFENLSGYYKVPFKPRLTQETPYVKTVVNGKDTVSLMVDTGHPTFITGYEWDENKFQIDSSDIQIARINRNLFGGKYKRDSILTKQYFRINSLEIGDYRLNNIVITGGVYIMGLDFMKNFDITIDWKNHQFYFKENGTNDFPKNIYTYGFRIRKFDNKLKIYMIYDNSLASKLGVKLGDEILSINGVSADNINEDVFDKINNELPFDNEVLFRIKGMDKNLNLKKEELFK